MQAHKNRNKGKKSRASSERKNKNSLVRREGVNSLSNAHQGIPRSVGLIMPDRYVTNLKYWKALTYNLSVTNYGSQRFSPSNAFDVDPLIGGTAMSGFLELVALYGSYRVVSSKCKLEFANPSSTVPLKVWLCPVNIDPGATPSLAYQLALPEQPYCKSKTAPLVGGPICTLSSKMSTERIYGSKMVLFDDNFSAPVTGSPNNNWFWVVGCYGFAVIAGITYANVMIDVEVEFYDRKFQQN